MNKYTNTNTKRKTKLKKKNTWIKQNEMNEMYPDCQFQMDPNSIVKTYTTPQQTHKKINVDIASLLFAMGTMIPSVIVTGYTCVCCFAMFLKSFSYQKKIGFLKK